MRAIFYSRSAKGKRAVHRIPVAGSILQVIAI